MTPQFTAKDTLGLGPGQKSHDFPGSDKLKWKP
jgi:hypothetical protein